MVLVEYADFQCGYCKRMTHVMRELEHAYHDDVLFIFKHFPMSPTCNDGVTNNRHRQACSSSYASICAQEQGMFWEYHDLTYKNQHNLGAGDLRHYAEEVGLNMSEWSACMRDEARLEAIVQEDAASGSAMEVTGTPRIFINGRMFRGVQPAVVLARQIELELGRDARTATQNVQSLSAIDAPLEGDPPWVAPSMTEIQYDDLHFFMDTFEASWDEVGGPAISEVGRVPVIGASWHQAAAACEAAGRRMCTEEEWIAACQGARPVDDDRDGEFADDYIEGWSYPYSDFYRREACWDEGDLSENRPMYTGSREGCRSRDNVFDLVGNLQEWAGTSAEDAVLLGGAYYNREKSRCYRRNDTFGAGLRNATTGFRCCADAPQ